MGLLLEAVEVAGPLRWRWLLTDEETGAALADHLVDLDPRSAEVTAFGDLYGYAREYAAPDRRMADESRIVAWAGEWAGRELLGEAIGAAIAAAAPETVRVAAAAPAESVLLWPLELAYADGRPLAARGDISLVYDVAPAAAGGVLPGAARRKDPVSETLRVLAVFSQPTETSVLALRRERYALARLIRRIAARERAVVELRVAQYGVTRQLLGRIVDSGGGWDVLHLSGHGGRGLFLLEHDDGSPDPVDAASLLELLRPARRRVKLAVVSACQSAAAATAQTLRLVGLADQAAAVEQAAVGQAGPEVAGLARSLVRELECAVVAMRYPVTDEFAIAFGYVLYEQLLSRRNPVDVAVARAVAKAAGAAPSPGRPAVSLATPGLFGARAAGLELAVPRGDPLLDPAEARMAYFPAEPPRFVGRAAAMAAASAALAPDSGRTAVLLHGMAGAGKTACALELAYRHQDSFAATAFWQAPETDSAFGQALAGLAVALEDQLGGYGFTMTGHIATAASLAVYLPRLRKVLDDSGVLVVLDNLETLLTADGAWRDPRWGPLIAALAGHGGESRLIVTSRVPPAGLGPETLVLPVHALSLGEAVGLARELPHLRGLLHADAGPVRADASADIDVDRDRVRRVLRVVQGHPKLLELTDAAAADREQLDRQLDAAEAAVAGQQLEAFFRDGASTLNPGQFLAALTGWTTTALTLLPPPARLLAQFLACLEDEDRQSPVIKATWEYLWRQLERSDEPPGLEPLLDALTTAALIQADRPGRAAGNTPQAADGGQPSAVVYRMHPGVAAAIAAAAGPEIRAAADLALAAFWQAVADQAQQRDGGEDSALIVQAGLAAAPYLLRHHDWDTVVRLLEMALLRDTSPGTVQAALPALRHAAEVTRAPEYYAVLARALRRVDPAEAEQMLRAAVRDAASSEDYKLASAIAGDLAYLLLNTGRLAEALDVITQKVGYTRRAGLGPWTQLGDQAQRLQVLMLMGQHRQVLNETSELQARLNQLPARPGSNERVSPWNVRETILNTGRNSAQELGEWQQCLVLNAEILASQRQRGVGEHGITRTWYNDAWPLIRLGRLAEAGHLLRECQQVYEDHRDIPGLAQVLAARAELEHRLGHRDTALDLGRIALRLSYARPDPRDIAASHYSLATYLGAAGAGPDARCAHWLAAALIYRLTGMTYRLADTQRAMVGDMRDTGGASGLPATLAEVIDVTGRTEGVRLDELITALQPDVRAAEAALAGILRAAADLPPAAGAAIGQQLQQWEPVIAAIVAASRGAQDDAEVRSAVDYLAGQPDGAALGAVLRRILDGDRGDSLLAGLDSVGTAIAAEILTRLASPEQPGS